jgi:hypothetical protein
MHRATLVASLSAALIWSAAVELTRGQPAAGTGRAVLATVVDARGRTIVDLDVDDFIVEESGEPREVFGVRIADYPVVVLLDNGAEAKGDFEAMRRAAERFVGRIGERAVALGTLADPPNLLTTFDDTREAVLEAVAQMPLSASPWLLPLQAIANGARAIGESGASFASIIVIASPYSLARETEPPALLTPILQSGAKVHIVARRPVDEPAQTATPRYEALLREIAGQTQGQFTPIYSTGSYVVALDRLADRMAVEMLVEYYVPPGSPVDPTVRVGVRVPGARVLGLGVAR